MRNIVVITPPPQLLRWVSLWRILPALENAWQEVEGSKVKVTAIRSTPELLGTHEKTLRKADLVVLTFNLLQKNYLPVLRTQLQIQAPVIIHSHGEGSCAFSPYGKEALSLLKTTDRFVSASRAEEKGIRLFWKSPKTSVAPFPALPETQRQNAFRYNQPRFVYAGRVSDQKRIEVLIQSLAILKKKKGFSDATLEIFGEEDQLGWPLYGIKSSPYLRTLKALARSLGVEKQIRFQGVVKPEIARDFILTPDKVLVSASVHSDEDFGMSVLDALANGCTAAISAWGGHLDWKSHFTQAVSLAPVVWTQNGPTVKPEAMAQAMKKAWLSTARAPERELKKCTPQAVAVILKKLLPAKTERAKPLEPTDLMNEIQQQIQKISKTVLVNGVRVKQVFTSWNDPYAKKLASSYGLRSSSSRTLASKKRPRSTSTS